jgi:hypothetical protein
MSGPLLAIAACAITIWLSVAHPDQPIVEGVVQRGLVVKHAAASASHRSTSAAR